jgi:hypothetical protein
MKQTNQTKQPKNNGLQGSFRALRRQATDSLLEFLEFSVIGAYFKWWSTEAKVKNAARVSAFTILGISNALLFLEVLSEAYGGHRIQTFMALAAEHKSLNFILFTVAVVLLAIHHIVESRKPEYEYKFIRRVHTLLRSSSSTEADILALLHSVFEKVGIKRISIYRLSTSGVLRINDDDVYPGTFESGERELFFIDLAPGEGVAGRVFNDQQIRYLPRTFLPSRRFLPKISFPHAIKIGYELREVVGKPFKELHLVDEEIESKCFKAPNGLPPFRSFLSVPLQTDENKCLGVLNFDFHRSNPLTKIDVAMAAVFGILLADVVAPQPGVANLGSG